MAICTFSPWLHGKQNFGSMLDSISSSAGLSSLDRDGASRLAGFKEEESCMPNLPTVGRQGNKNQGLWDEITKEKD